MAWTPSSTQARRSASPRAIGVGSTALGGNASRVAGVGDRRGPDRCGLAKRVRGEPNARRKLPDAALLVGSQVGERGVCDEPLQILPRPGGVDAADLPAERLGQADLGEQVAVAVVDGGVEPRARDLAIDAYAGEVDDVTERVVEPGPGLVLAPEPVALWAVCQEQLEQGAGFNLADAWLQTADEAVEQVSIAFGVSDGARLRDPREDACAPQIGALIELGEQGRGHVGLGLHLGGCPTEHGLEVAEALSGLRRGRGRRMNRGGQRDSDAGREHAGRQRRGR